MGFADINILFNPKCKHDVDFAFPRKTAVMKITGGWPLDPAAWERWPILCLGYKCWSWIVIINIIYTMSGETLYFFDHIDSIAACTENLCTNIMAGLILVRLLHIQLNQPLFVTTIDKFVANIWMSNNSNPHVKRLCESRLNIYDKIVFMEMGTIIMYVSIPIVIILFTNVDMSAPNKPMSFMVSYPYDYEHNLFVFWLTHFYTGCAGFTVAMQFFAQDALLTLFLSYTCGQFEVLHQRIARLIPECHDECVKEFGAQYQQHVPAEQIQDKYVRRLNDIIAQHNVLIDFCKDVEDFNGLPLLTNFFNSTFVICLVLLQYVAGDLILLEYVKFTVYLMSLLWQIFILSLNGDRLMEYSSSTAWHLYACNWEGGHLTVNSALHTMAVPEVQKSLERWQRIHFYPTGKHFQQKLQIMMMRSQKPLCLTAFSFAVVSLETFSNLLKSSLSYFTVLKTFITD